MFANRGSSLAQGKAKVVGLVTKVIDLTLAVAVGEHLRECEVIPMLKMVLAFCFLGSFALAQSVGVKDIPADGDTTIEIKKGSKTQNEYEVVTSEDEIEGEAAPLLKEARTNWKKACADWKTETKELNKDNQVLTLSCGKMTCSTVAMESTCRSTATVKIKTRVK